MAALEGSAGQRCGMTPLQPGLQACKYCLGIQQPHAFRTVIYRSSLYFFLSILFLMVYFTMRRMGAAPSQQALTFSSEQ
jgi:hypothetical protein